MPLGIELTRFFGRLTLALFVVLAFSSPVLAQSLPTCSALVNLTGVGSIQGSASSPDSAVSASVSLAEGDTISQIQISWSLNGLGASNAQLTGFEAYIRLPGPPNTTVTSTQSVNPPATEGVTTITFNPPWVAPQAISQLTFGVRNKTFTETLPVTATMAFNFFATCSTAVVDPVLTTTVLNSSPNPSLPGESVTFTANVAAGSGSPEGSVEFREGTTVLGTATLAGGSATFSTSSLPVGNHLITAHYLGSSSHLASASEPLNQVVSVLGTAIVLTTTNNCPATGESVTLTATVSPATATGIVEFREGATVLATGTLSGGVASYTTSALPAGMHIITAYYLGDSSHAASASQPLKQNVNSKHSIQIANMQEAATGVAAMTSTAAITDGVTEEIGSALSGQVEVVSASEGKVGLVYAPGMGNGSVITPTASLAQGKSDFANWRLWASLRYSDLDASTLEGNQINSMAGVSFLFGDGLVAGLVAGYENQDYEDDVNATLKGDGYSFGGYVGGAIGKGFYFDAQAHAALLNYDLASGPVTGSTDGTRMTVAGGFTHVMQFDALTIENAARYSLTREWQDAYTDSAAVDHGKRDFNFGRLSAGSKIMYRFDMDGGGSISPFASAYADYQFSGGNAADTLFDGVSARAGLGINLRTGSGISASALAEFSGLGLDNNATTKSFKAQLAIPF